MSSIFGTKEEILARLEGYKRMNAWTDAQNARITPAEALDALDDLYDFMPPKTRARRDDPAYDGARFMMSTLSRLRG
ncbi:MAG: hypothetical protein ACTHQM_22400 [Thermoanaerobaculia bacterium]